jgi:NAD(P)-dependent dehydrogenase (short-subunit alcohol dehydrogenase family)
MADVGGRIVLVTGASRGIGKATALAFLAAGAKTVLAARDGDKMAAAIAEAGATDDRALAVTCDVGDPGDVDRLFAAIKDRFGRLDAVFNNAGANVPATDFGDVSFEDWRKVMAVNLDGCFLIARGAYRMMREQSPKGGRIINNGSISAYAPRPGSVAYTASKHAISGLTRTISLDGRKHDIACGQIDIGNAATDMASRMADGVPQADGSIRPEPLMDVAHVADMVVHMAGLPLSANVQSVTVMATNMPFVGRG